ncbi:mediator complex, subunit Med20 [Aspergillus bertholletiae]|uniref:Mediator of RNA polymerase II transcription subunit 20 n=1 Tax=Aspergillus bertholletiae TaxID=1226010 RepID=A0A5N7BEZ3_9EURO|nr:mediator complex, subunit Med20 [Aspergillus bertholletiae]
MPITGVFFIPSNPNASTAFTTITERLHSSLADEPIPVGRWALEHKLMRDTPSCLPASTSQRPAQPRYMQFLSLTYFPNHGFIYTSPPPEKVHHTHPSAGSPGAAATGAPSPVSPSPVPQQATPTQAPAPNSQDRSSMVMTTVPLPSCSTLFQHFVYACQPFWCHRHTVTVPGGVVYDVGDFRVRIGDVRQTQPTARIRGTVVEIEWKGPSLVTSIASLFNKSKTFGGPRDSGLFNDDGDSGIDVAFPEGLEEADIDAEYAATATLIREFWARLGIEGAREAILVPDIGRESKEQLRKLKQLGNQKAHQTLTSPEGSGQQDEDPDPEAGIDVARQFMEIFRFNR